MRQADAVFPASRTEGLRRLEDFLPRAGRVYADGRNHDYGPEQRGNVSVLSPYLRYRLVTEPEVAAATLRHHGAEAAGKFLQEVAWRTYWKGWLELRPAVWTRFIAERDAARAEMLRDADMAEAVARAEAGATGIEGFDDWARELVAFGYLHNHARMWFASIWIFTLRLPWVLGADFFMRHLVDADPASNTLSWRWVAGLQTRGKTYLATAENMARYTGGRYRPRELARQAVALTEAPLPRVRPLPSLPAADQDEPALLLVTAEDLHPESLFPRIGSLRGALVARAGGDWPWGDKAASFVAAAAEETAQRVQGYFDCRVNVVEKLTASAVMAAADEAGVKIVLTAYAPVGPLADAIDQLAKDVAACGVRLVRARRGWDDRLWPLATRGYFAFRERLPEVLAEDGL